MIINLISEIQNTVQSNVEKGTGNWQLYLFIGILVVCVALFIYFLRRTDRLVENQGEIPGTKVAKKPEKTKDLHGEEAAAIALAIHLYKSELHDMESFTITLQKVSRIYSPWSSKIYSLRQYPRS
jgi:glutaconyl-CoA/methylmalonyl-CoA decarboxylase subunit delta